MGGDPFDSICLTVVGHSAAELVLTDVATGETLTFAR